MDQPLVSVCLITYNHENYIRQAIDSILMQEVDFPWEIIIADDASSDRTQNIIREYHQKYPDLIKPNLKKKNVGAGLNFVELINSAKGKFVAYLEGDDYWTSPLKLQLQYDYMEKHKNISLCYHKVDWVYTYDSPEKYRVESNQNDKSVYTLNDIIKLGWFIRSCSMFFINYKLPRGFEKLHIGDYPLHVLLATKGNIGFIDERMGTYRINHEGLSETILSNISLKSELVNIRKDIEMNLFLVRKVNLKGKMQILSKLFIKLYRLTIRMVSFLLKKTSSFLMINNGTKL